MTWLFYLLLVLFIFICLVLTLLVLIQKGRGGGLASAFGGGGGNTAFGSKTGDVLTWATSVVFGIFLLLAIALNLVANRLHAATTEVIAPPVAVPAASTPDRTPSGSSVPANVAPPVEQPQSGSTGAGVAPTRRAGTQPGN